MSAIELVTRAALFAAEKHALQRRKSNSGQTPYINHPLSVATILAVHGAPTESVVAAFLHDTVEDTGTTREELVTHFGEQIASIVMECTDDRSLPKVERKKRQVSSGKGKTGYAKLVKMADKYDNLRDLSTTPPTGWSPERVLGYAVWAAAVVDEIRGVSEELDRKVDDLLESMIPKDADKRRVILEHYYASMSTPTDEEKK